MNEGLTGAGYSIQDLSATDGDTLDMAPSKNDVDVAVRNRSWRIDMVEGAGRLTRSPASRTPGGVMPFGFGIITRSNKLTGA